MPETQNIRNDNAHEHGIRFLSLLNLMTLVFPCMEKHAKFSFRLQQSLSPFENEWFVFLCFSIESRIFQKRVRRPGSSAFFYLLL